MHGHRARRPEHDDALRRVAAEPLAPPSTEETAGVPSLAMGEWRALRLGERGNSLANRRFVAMDVFFTGLAGPAGRTGFVVAAARRDASRLRDAAR